jgi:hypothetical protein
VLKHIFALVALGLALISAPAEARNPHGIVPTGPVAFSEHFGAKTLIGEGGFSPDPYSLGVAPYSIFSDPSGIWKVDTHNQLVATGSYANPAPSYGAGSYPVTIADSAGHHWVVTISIVANQWNWTNINSGTNADTSSANQLRTATTSAAEGDIIEGRDGAVFNATEPVADWRTASRTNTMPADYAAYTARTLPSNLWVHLTCEHTQSCTIRKLTLTGGNGTSTQATLGYWFDGINFARPYVATLFSPGDAPLLIGTGVTAYAEFVQVSNSSFSSTLGTATQLGDTGSTAELLDGISTSQNDRELYIHDNTFTGLYDGMALNGNLGVTAVGSGYTNGSYTGVAVTDTTNGACTGLTANVVVSSAQVQGVTLGGSSTGCVAGDTLTISSSLIGGTGSGFSLAYQRNLRPTDFFLVGNSFNAVWDHDIQTGEAAPVYSEWNQVFNHPYPNGGSHGDFEIRQYETTVSGDYPWGDAIGNIWFRGTGFPGWADGQGLQSGGNNPAGATFNSAKVEGNVYEGTFACFTCIDYLDTDAVVSFNTAILDPTSGITQPSAPTQTGIVQNHSAGGYTVSYNATEAAFFLGTGVGVGVNITPNLSNNVTVSPANYANAYAGPAFGLSVQTVTQAVAAWSMKSGGMLDPVTTGFTYKVGAVGTYFDFVNRVSTAPF